MKSQEDRLLELFGRNGGHLKTSDIPRDLAYEYRRAISVLRHRRGYQITATRLTKNNWIYELAAARGPVPAPVPPPDLKTDETGQVTFI